MMHVIKKDLNLFAPVGVREVNSGSKWKVSSGLPTAGLNGGLISFLYNFCCIKKISCFEIIIRPKWSTISRQLYNIQGQFPCLHINNIHALFKIESNAYCFILVILKPEGRKVRGKWLLFTVMDTKKHIILNSITQFNFAFFSQNRPSSVSYLCVRQVWECKSVSIYLSVFLVFLPDSHPPAISSLSYNSYQPGKIKPNICFSLRRWDMWSQPTIFLSAALVASQVSATWPIWLLQLPYHGCGTDWQCKTAHLHSNLWLRKSGAFWFLPLRQVQLLQRNQRGKD